MWPLLAFTVLLTVRVIRDSYALMLGLNFFFGPDWPQAQSGA